MRKKLSYKVVEFGKLVGLSIGAMSEVENDNRQPPFKALLSICELAFENDIDLPWLLLGKYSNTNILHENNVDLTQDEKQILSAFRSFDLRGRAAIMNAVIYEQDRLGAIDGSKEVIDKHMPVITNGLHKNKEERRERDETSEELAIPDGIYGMDSLVKR